MKLLLVYFAYFSGDVHKNYSCHWFCFLQNKVKADGFVDLSFRMEDNQKLSLLVSEAGHAALSSLAVKLVISALSDLSVKSSKQSASGEVVEIDGFIVSSYS